MITRKELEKYDEDCAYLDESSTLSHQKLVTVLVLRCSFQFKNGFLPEKKAGIKLIFDNYFAKWGKHLGWGYDPLYPGGDLVAKGFSIQLVKKLHQALDQASPDGEYEWAFLQGDGPDHIGDHGIRCFTAAAWEPGGSVDGSFLNLWWPYNSVMEGAWSDIHTFILEACRRLEVVHGYAGFSLALPLNDAEFKNHEIELAKKYYCLEIDDPVGVGLMTQEMNGVKGVNWYTIIGPEYLGKLPGEAMLRNQLHTEDCTIFTLQSGAIVIRIGTEPEMGPIKKGLPPRYVAVSKIIKPIRTTNIYSFGQGAEMESDAFNLALTERWFQRFDAPGIWPPRSSSN